MNVTNPTASSFRRAATRNFWLVAAGIVAILLAPGIAFDAGYANAYASTAAVLILSVFTFVKVVALWLAAGILCGLAMERQPLYRNLYLLVPLLLYLLAFPRIS